MTQVKDIAVTGEQVANLKDKAFTIINEAVYQLFQDLDKPEDAEAKKEKMVVMIELSDGSKVDYFPNRTSIKTLTAKFGTDTAKWIQKKAEFEIEKRDVFGTKKQVLFVKE